MRAALRGMRSPSSPLRSPSLVSTFYLSSAVAFPPPWSLKAIIISLQRCQNPTLHFYLEEPYRDEWNLSADRDEWLPPTSPELSDTAAPLNKRWISLHFKCSLIPGVRCCRRRRPPPPAAAHLPPPHPRLWYPPKKWLRILRYSVRRDEVSVLRFNLVPKEVTGWNDYTEHSFTIELSLAEVCCHRPKKKTQNIIHFFFPSKTNPKHTKFCKTVYLHLVRAQGPNFLFPFTTVTQRRH